MSLAVTPNGSSPSKRISIVFGRGCEQRLRREHVLDLGGADPECERAERAVRRGVAVAADDRHPRLGQPELRAHHVDDPLAAAAGGVQRHAELGAVARQRVELRLRERVADRAGLGRDVVVHRRDRQVGPAHLPSGEAQPLEGLRARHLVDEMEVDVEQRRLAGPLVDDVRVPDPSNSVVPPSAGLPVAA